MNGLCPDEVEHLRGRLLAAESSLSEGLAATAGESKPVDLELAIGRLSRVDAMQDQQMARARRERVVVSLQQVRSALARLDAGTYGACIRCEEPIGAARLEARPEALLCRGCQLGEG